MEKVKVYVCACMCVCGVGVCVVWVCVCVCVCVCGDHYLFIYLVSCQGAAMELVKGCFSTVKGCDGTWHHDRN